MEFETQKLRIARSGNMTKFLSNGFLNSVVPTFDVLFTYVSNDPCRNLVEGSQISSFIKCMVLSQYQLSKNQLPSSLNTFNGSASIVGNSRRQALQNRPNLS